MLPNRSRTKEDLIRKITVYNDVPSEFKDKEFTSLEKTKFNEKSNFMTLKDLAKLLGGKW
jgi:ribosomal protein L13